MKLERFLFFMVILSAGALITYAAGPLLARGVGSLYLLIADVVRLLLGLPQRVWWLLAVAILMLLTFYYVLRLGIKALEIPKTLEDNPQRISYHPGRLSALRGYIAHAHRGAYSQYIVRRELRNLAIDLISLRLGVIEAEAMRRMHEGSWTDDEALKDYTNLEWDTGVHRRWLRLRKWFASSEPRVFMRETNDALDRLWKYYNSMDERVGFDAGNRND